MKEFIIIFAKQHFPGFEDSPFISGTKIDLDTDVVRANVTCIMAGNKEIFTIDIQNPQLKEVYGLFDIPIEKNKSGDYFSPNLKEPTGDSNDPQELEFYHLKLAAFQEILRYKLGNSE